MVANIIYCTTNKIGMVKRLQIDNCVLICYKI